MTTYIFESFNHVLKDACVLLVFILVQLIFYRINVYFVTQRENAYDYIVCGIIRSSIVQLELNINMLRSKDHVVVYFNVDVGTFQVHPSCKPSVKKNV